MSGDIPKTTLPEHFYEGIRDNGTIEGTIVERHYQTLERIEMRRGYVAIISDAGAVDAETRIPVEMLRKFLESANAK